MCFYGCKCDPCEAQREIDSRYSKARYGAAAEYLEAGGVLF